MNYGLFILGQGVAEMAIAIAVCVAILVGLGLFFVIIKCYRKVPQGTALVRTGYGGVKVSFSGMVVLPVLHRMEHMDVSLKRVEIYRHGTEGLVCKDNVRADIKVAFFVRVNNLAEDVLKVAQCVGCIRASDQQALVELFDAKFSEALKTVGKRFDFTELYSEREAFKVEILKVIGTDLNGFVLDDAAIDYLEQTPLDQHDPTNILDAEGIKKITDLTAREVILANEIARNKERTIKKQDVETREAVLELEKQQREAEEKQKREIASITAREQAEAAKVAQEERLKSERARISTEEEVGVAEQNKARQILVAQRNKERTDAVEVQRVQRDSDVEATERERIVELARIDKEKALEVERKKIQDVIRERVAVERTVAEEQERIKDVREFAGAERLKKVTIISAEASAQEDMVKQVKAAEGEKQAAAFKADQVLMEAEAKRSAAEKEAAGKKLLAEATAAEAAAAGLAEVEVMDAKAGALQKYGNAEAEVIQKKAEAEAAGGLARAKATQAQGEAEATVLQRKYEAEAEGVTRKAEAMKKLDAVGKDHEEFKLRLAKDQTVELAQVKVQADVASSQALVLAEALKHAQIDIVGGDGQFFDQITGAITQGKRIDRLVGNSTTLGDLKQALLGDGTDLIGKVRGLIERVGISSDDVKNLTLAALVGKMIGLTSERGVRDELKQILTAVTSAGLGDRKLGFLDGANGGHGTDQPF